MIDKYCSCRNVITTACYLAHFKLCVFIMPPLDATAAEE